MSNTRPTDSDLDALARAHNDALEAMDKDSTPTTRAAYRKASRAYNAALDAAVHDPTRW